MEINLRKHQSASLKLELEHNSVGALLDQKAKKFPDKYFIISPGMEEVSLTYSGFYDIVNRTSSFLMSLGLKKGNKIGLVISNSTEFLFLYFAGLKNGIVIVPVNSDIATDEIKYILHDSEAKVVFYQENMHFKMSSLPGDLPGIKFIPFNNYKDFVPPKSKSVSSEVITPDIRLDDLAVIIYTSGTTGKPKGVVLSHMNLLSDSKALCDWFSFDENTRTLCILPLFHNNGQVVTLLAPLQAGGSTVIVSGKTSLMAFWGFIKKYEITFTSVMASILSILLSLPIEREDKTLKGIICGGQVLTSNVQKAFEERFEVPVFEGFGLTETTSFSCFNDYPADRRRPGSIGRPLPVNDMEILDEEGNIIHTGNEGEICIRGYNLCVEYLGLPEKNDFAFRGGWFHSGDFGYKDDDGYFYFKGRKDFLIIKGGENIYPAEVENVIYLHPSVAEVAVIGIPDPLLGQDIAVFVKLKEGCLTDENEIKLFCRDRIAAFKQPKKVIIIDQLDDLNEIPKGPTKKVLYNKLQDYYLVKLIN